MDELLVSVVVPFLNEEECIPDFLSAIEGYAAKVDFSLEVLFVDDGSTDHSCMMLQAHTPTHLCMRLIRLSRNFGSHAAIRAGLSQATGDCATFIGIDLQEPLSMIDQMVDQIKAGYDVVCGQKAQVQVSRSERFFSNLYTNLVQKYAVPAMPDGGCNSLMLSRKALDELNRHIEGNSSLALQILSMGFKTAIVQMQLVQRSHGKSKWTASKKIKLFIDSFVSFSDYPLHLITILGILFASTGFVYALVIIIGKLLDPAFVISGWASLICILLLGFGMSNISLGIIAEYLWRTLDASRRRPIFIIDENIDLGVTNAVTSGERK